MFWTLRAGDSCGRRRVGQDGKPLPTQDSEGQLPGTAVEGRSPLGSTGRWARGCRCRGDIYVHSGALLPEGSWLS